MNEENDYRVIIDPEGIENNTEYFIGIKLNDTEWDVPFLTYFSVEDLKGEMTKMMSAFNKPMLRLNNDESFKEVPPINV